MTELSKDCLDFGHVKLLNIAGPSGAPMGSRQLQRDAAKTARMSFGGAGKQHTEEKDMGLSGYLWNEEHSTPFEFIQVWLEMKMPIFVSRQLVRHRTVSINEESMRYIDACCDWYIPEQFGAKAANVKQGSVGVLDAADNTELRGLLDSACADGFQRYNRALEMGTSNEHARLFLHVNHYTRWWWRQDFRNLMHMVRLRTDPHAQMETRVYAEAVVELVREQMPDLIAVVEEANALIKVPPLALGLLLDYSIKYVFNKRTNSNDPEERALLNERLDVLFEIQTVLGSGGKPQRKLYGALLGV